MSAALTIVVSALAAQRIRAAEEWWRVNRPKAPTALQEDLDRAASLITRLGPYEISSASADRGADTLRRRDSAARLLAW